MKFFYSLVLLLTVATAGWSQTYTWIGADNGNWNTAANWSPSRGSASSNDVLLFNQGNTRTINFPGSNLTVGKILISNNTTIRLQSAAGSQRLTIGGGTGDDFVIEAGSSFIQDATMESVFMAASTNAVINGTYTEQAADGFYVTSNAASVAVNGTFVNQSGGINGASATKVYINAGGTYAHDRNGGSVPTATWNTGSILDFSGVTTSFPGFNQTYSDVVFSSNLSGTVILNDNLSCRNLTVDIPGDNIIVNETFWFGTTWNISGNFTLENAGNFLLSNDIQSVTFNIGGNMIINGGSFSMKQDIGSASVNVAGNFVQTGGTYFGRAAGMFGSSTLNVDGAFTISGGTMNFSNVNSTSSTLNIGGHFTITSGTLTEQANGSANGAINFVGTGVQNFVRTGGNLNNILHFNVASGSTLNFDATSVLNGGTNSSFTVTNGGKVITAHNAGLVNAGTNAGSVQTTARTYNTGADYEFRGAATGNFGTGTVRDLIINNTSGQVALGRAITVNGNLSLANGYLTPTASNTITVGNAGTASTANGAFVNGQLFKTSNAVMAAPFIFPVGKTGAGLRTISLQTTTTSSSTFVAEFFPTSPRTRPNGSVFGSGLASVSNCEYWTLNRPTGTAQGNITLTYTAASNCNAPLSYVGNPATLRIGLHNGSTWLNQSGTTGAVGGSTQITGSIITPAAVSTFGVFALATSNASDNPLPVLFADVKAYGKNDGIQVEWSNLTERDILNYEVERSTNGIDFTAVNQQLPKRNLDDKASYTFFDANPVQGANFYRIRVQEKGGKVIYSRILRVELGGNVKKAFGLYPNPVVGKQMTISLTGIQAGKYNLNVVNTTGQVVFRKTIVAAGTGVTEMVELPATLKAGMYTGSVTGDNYHESKLFIVQ